jgi:hypothetical protein
VFIIPLLIFFPALFWINRKIDAYQKDKDNAITNIFRQIVSLPSSKADLGAIAQQKKEEIENLPAVEKYEQALAALKKILSDLRSQNPSNPIEEPAESNAPRISSSEKPRQEVKEDYDLESLSESDESDNEDVFFDFSQEDDVFFDAEEISGSDSEVENNAPQQLQYDNQRRFFTHLTNDDLKNPDTFLISNILGELERTHQSEGFDNYITTVTDPKSIRDQCEYFIASQMSSILNESNQFQLKYDWLDILRTEDIQELKYRPFPDGTIYNVKIYNKWIPFYHKGYEIVFFDSVTIERFLNRQLTLNAPDPFLGKFFAEKLLPKDFKYLKWAAHVDEANKAQNTHCSFTLLRSGNKLEKSFQAQIDTPVKTITASLKYEVEQEIEGQVGTIHIPTEDRTCEGMLFTRGLHVYRTERKLSEMNWFEKTARGQARGFLNPFLKGNNVWENLWNRQKQDLIVDIDQVGVVYHRDIAKKNQQPTPGMPMSMVVSAKLTAGENSQRTDDIISHGPKGHSFRTSMFKAIFANLPEL